MKNAHHSKTLQEFFKVFVPETCSTQLRIPKAFTKFFNGITFKQSKATLVDHDNNSWDIDLVKIEDCYVFKNGWQQFAIENCLEEHDFLVFEYDGKSKFYVKIFSKSGCKKEAQICGKVVLVEDSDKSCRKIQRGSKRKHSTLGLKINEKSNSKGPSKGSRSKSTRTYEENGDDYEKKVPALAKCVPLDDPHFVVHFSQWRLKRVEIPRVLLRQWDMKVMSKLSLRDENGKLWPVTISTIKNGRLFLGYGWSDFQNSHNIQEGYKCDFQMVIGKTNVVQELLVRVHPTS